MCKSGRLPVGKHCFTICGGSLNFTPHLQKCFFYHSSFESCFKEAKEVLPWHQRTVSCTDTFWKSVEANSWSLLTKLALGLSDHAVHLWRIKQKAYLLGEILKKTVIAGLHQTCRDDRTAIQPRQSSPEMNVM